MKPRIEDLDSTETETSNETDGFVERVGGAGKISESPHASDNSNDNCKHIIPTASEEVRPQHVEKAVRTPPLPHQGLRSPPRSQPSPRKFVLSSEKCKKAHMYPDQEPRRSPLVLINDANGDRDIASSLTAGVGGSQVENSSTSDYPTTSRARIPCLEEKENLIGLTLKEVEKGGTRTCCRCGAATMYPVGLEFAAELKVDVVNFLCDKCLLNSRHQNCGCDQCTTITARAVWRWILLDQACPSKSTV